MTGGPMVPVLSNISLYIASYPQVLEYMAGGDLLNLLIERDIFEEDFTRFYVAEVRIPRQNITNEKSLLT